MVVTSGRNTGISPRADDAVATPGGISTVASEPAIDSAPGEPGCDVSISIIVPVYGNDPSFRQCVASLIHADPPAMEIIVVVDGESTHRTDFAGTDGVTVIQTSRRSGPAAARNLGARHACGEVLLFVDADVSIPRDTVGRVARGFKDPTLEAMIGSYDAAPTAKNFLSQYKNLVHHYTHQRGHERAFTFFGACGAIRREVFTAMKGFDERWLCIEDIELGYRLRAAGHEIRLCKDVQVTHHKRWTLVSLLKTDIFVRAIPWSELILRTGRLENDLNVDRASRIKVALLGLLVTLLAASLAWRPALALAAVCAATLVLMDLPLWRFFVARRGVLFAVRALAPQWLYYGYSGASFAWCAARHHLGMTRPSRQKLAGMTSEF